MRRNNKSIDNGFIAILLVCILMPTVLTACGSSRAPRQNVATVTGIKAAAATITTNVEYSSKLKPVQEVTVSPKIVGKVATIQADVGNDVEQGQTLFTLESNDLQAQLAQQKANVEVNRVNLEKARGSSFEQQLLQAEQAQLNAQIAYKNAKDNYDNYQKLFNAGAASKLDFDNARDKLDSAAIALKSANDNLNLLKNQAGPQTIQAAQAQVSQAESAMSYAQAQVQNSIIVSPISGTVSIRNIEVGEIASSSTPAFTVINTKTMIAQINVPDRMIDRIRKGQSVSVKIAALNDKTFNGTVDLVSPAVDTKTLTYPVRVDIDNPGGELKSGMFARVILPAEKKDNAINVPNEAISVQDGVPYVYTVENNVVKKKAVQLGLSNDKITEITDGLKLGDFVVTEGQIFLNDGQRVNIAK